MKHRLVLLGCLLFLAGLNAAAQEGTSPLPPPEADTSPLPGPDESGQAWGTSSQAGSSGAARSGSASRSTARSPAQSTPAQSAPARSAPARSAPARSTPAQSAPAQAATAQPAAAQTGIPSKGMFWGAMIGGGNSEYEVTSGTGEADGGSFNLDLLFGYDFGLLALQWEVLFSTGGGNYEFYDNPSWHNINFYITTLRIPLLLKLDLHWKRIMFQPQAGFYLNFGLGDISYEDNNSYIYSFGSGDLEYSSPLFGAMIGGAFGVRIGRGYLFLDIRYAVDLGKTEVKDVGIKFERNTTMVNLGYQYYFRGKQ